MLNCVKKKCVMENKFNVVSPENYSQKIFANQLVTIEDLLHFKTQLLEELLIALKSQTSIVPKKWMKSCEVRQLLKISPGTLQHLKTTGAIPHSKIGGTVFYNHDDILRLLTPGKADRIGKNPQ